MDLVQRGARFLKQSGNPKACRATGEVGVGLGHGQQNPRAHARTRNVYNDFGYLKEVRRYVASDDGKPNDQLQGFVYWMADSYDVSGRINGEVYGNGLINDRVYSAATGRLRTAAIRRRSAFNTCNTPTIRSATC
jgi:hypothetical protein